MPRRRTEIDAVTSEIIQLAWCDKTSFDAIHATTGLAEKEVIALMRRHLRPASFRLWRRRVTGRKIKHAKRSATQTD